MDITLVIPVYNEGTILHHVIKEVRYYLEKWTYKYEIILVDDGSNDNSWEIIEQLSIDKQIKGVKLSRNFGKEAAVFAGIKHSRGKCTVIMDSDLQHPPSLIEEMYNIWKNNDVHIVEARKRSRGQEGILYKLSAGLFYKAINKLGNIDLEGASDFKLIDRTVIKVLDQMPERQIFFRGMSTWTGLASEIIYFDVEPRHGGETKWSLIGLFKYAINSLTSYTSAPLQLVTYIGISFIVFSILLGIQTVFKYMYGNAVEGFTTVILVLLFMGGIIMSSLGIIGHYISKIYEEIKRRPKFIISKKVNCEDLEKEY